MRQCFIIHQESPCPSFTIGRELQIHHGMIAEDGDAVVGPVLQKLLQIQNLALVAPDQVRLLSQVGALKYF